MKLGFSFLVALGAAATYGQTAAPTVEFILFSGRDRPKAVLAQENHAQAALDSLQARASATFPCAELPDMGSTPLYNGVLVSLPEPVLQRKTMVVQKGFIHYDDGKPCYRDADSRLEALLVSLAFEYEDINAPQGPRSMEYLACMVPDTLHPNIAPCGTSRLAPRRRAPRRFEFSQAPWDFARFAHGHARSFSLTGRRLGIEVVPPKGEESPAPGLILKR